MYKLDSRFIGSPPIEAVVAAPAAATPYLVPATPGMLVRAEDPVWGPGEFVFARANGTIKMKAGVVLLPVWDATNKVYTMNATEWPATTLIGRPLYISMAEGAGVGSAVNSLTVGQYGWFMTSGRTPVNGNATIAADTVASHIAAGQLGALAAGQALQNARVITPATQTVVSAGSGNAGEFVIGLANTAGFFAGGYVSGTGVGAAAIVTSVAADGKSITVSVANSAAVTGNVTITYNNATIFYNVLEMNRLAGQGPIT